MKFLDKFKKGIDKSSSYLKKNIERIVLNNKIDEKILNEIEDLLITADLGTKVSKKLVCCVVVVDALVVVGPSK